MADDEEDPEFDWRHYFELAQELAQRADEAAQRSAVSRSYYAAFHVAQRVLDHLDSDFSSMRSRDSHQQVWDRVAALHHRQAKSASRSGRDLLHARKNADYQSRVRGWPRRTATALEQAERAITSLAELLP
jgi:uncharacterized protein (UPF0332 family)